MKCTKKQIWSPKFSEGCPLNRGFPLNRGSTVFGKKIDYRSSDEERLFSFSVLVWGSWCGVVDAMSGTTTVCRDL